MRALAVLLAGLAAFPAQAGTLYVEAGRRCCQTKRNLSPIES